MENVELINLKYKKLSLPGHILSFLNNSVYRILIFLQRFMYENITLSYQVTSTPLHNNGEHLEPTLADRKTTAYNILWG